MPDIDDHSVLVLEAMLGQMGMICGEVVVAMGKDFRIMGGPQQPCRERPDRRQDSEHEKRCVCIP